MKRWRSAGFQPAGKPRNEHAFSANGLNCLATFVIAAGGARGGRATNPVDDARGNAEALRWVLKEIGAEVG